MFEELESIEQELSELRELRKLKTSEVIKEHHPLKIGDEVVVNHDYSHIGKTIVVDFLGLKKNWRQEYQFYAVGCVKRVDGSVGVNRGKWIDKEQGQ